MKKKRATLKITGITHYEDVETGTLVLERDGRTKSWKAVWVSRLRDGVGLRSGTLPLRFRNYGPWIDCPRVALNHQTFMWMEPLNAASWIDLGVNLYLCSDEGWPEPLPRRDFEQLTMILLECGIDCLTVEEPQRVEHGNRLNHDVLSSFCWDKANNSNNQKV